MELREGGERERGAVVRSSSSSSGGGHAAAAEKKDIHLSLSLSFLISLRARLSARSSPPRSPGGGGGRSPTFPHTLFSLAAAAAVC